MTQTTIIQVGIAIVVATAVIGFACGVFYERFTRAVVVIDHRELVNKIGKTPELKIDKVAFMADQPVAGDDHAELYHYSLANGTRHQGPLRKCGACWK